MKKETVFFEYNKKKIGGFLYIPSGEGRSPAVIFVHGHGGGTHEVKNQVMCEALAQEGLVTFLFDFYDKPNGLSEIPIEDMTVSLQLKILRKAVDFIASRKEVDQKRIGLTGHSLGGMTVLLYTPTDSRIKALVAQSSVSQFGKTKGTSLVDKPDWKEHGYKIFDKSWGKMKVKWQYIEDGLTHDVYAATEKITCPVLVFHGNEDESVPLAQSEKLAKHLKKTDLFITINNADHCYKTNDTLPVATKLLVDFIKEKL